MDKKYRTWNGRGNVNVGDRDACIGSKAGTSTLAKMQKWTNLVDEFVLRLTVMSEPARIPHPTPPQATVAQMSAAGLRAFFNIARDWALTADEQIVLLGSPGRSTFFKWKASPE